MNEIIDIEERQKDFDSISREIQNLELGIRAISVMYNEHSSDKNSATNIFRLKDNIYYRLSSARHQYGLLLEEIYRAEHSLELLMQKDPNALNGFLFSNPYYEQIEAGISSIFDGLIANIASIFDYFSHIVCYICKRDKANTTYWTRLAKAARGKDNEISKLKIAVAINTVDRSFVTGLYDYRSRLLHHKRDHHILNPISSIQGKFNIQIVSSDESIKHFKLIRQTFSDTTKFTLPFLTSWLITTTSKQIDTLLESLLVEIKSESNFPDNLKYGKGEKWFPTGTVDRQTKTIILTSDVLWEQYKKISFSA